MKIDEKKISEYADKFRKALENPKTSITKEKLEDLKKKVEESLSLDRQKMLSLQPFTGGMMMHFEIVPIRDYRCATAMTDGSRIFFDIDFYSRLSDKERIFVLAHECWHCIYLHFLRKQGRESDLWNIATDCEINYMLKNQGFSAPSELCYPEPGEEGLSAEEIYERRFKKSKKQKHDGGENGGQSSGYGQRNGNGESNDEKGGISGQFDKHVTDEDEENGDNGMLPKDKWGEKGEDPDYHPRISQDVAEKIRESVISEAQKYERSRGTLPGGLESVINRFRKPEISWKELLCQEISKCYSERREWLPPNRRYVHKGLYLQSHRGEKVKCCVMIDTSGSTTTDLPKFMGELVGLLNTFSNYEMTLIQCDAKVQSVEKFDDVNPFPVEDASKIKFSGFGGSDLNPAFEYLEEELAYEDEYPNMVVVFTDGYIAVPETPPPCNVLWILTSDGNKDIAPYGRKIVFKEKREENNV